MKQYFNISNEALVTIIIPAFNSEKHMRRCLESCVSQTYSNIEVIVVNDGSTDDTKSIAESFSNRLNNFKILDFENGGQGRARNRALKVAMGKYVWFLDSDDTIHDNCIELMLNAIDSNNADFVFCDWVFVNENKVKFGYSNFSKDISPGKLPKTKQLELLKRTFFTVNKLYRKSFLVANNIFFGEGYIYEDVEFSAGVILLAKKSFYVPYPFYQVHVNSESTTKTNYNTHLHADSYSKAIDVTVKKYTKNLQDVSKIFIHHVLGKSYFYTVLQSRIPIYLWPSFLKNILFSLSALSENKNFKETKFKYRLPIIYVKKLPSFSIFLYFTANYFSRIRTLRTIYFYFKKLFRKLRATYYSKRFKTKRLDNNIDNKTILLHGFDNKLIGNTKYLLQSNLLEGYDVYLVTNSNINHTAYPLTTIKKGSSQYYKISSKARFHFLESWTDLSIPKSPGSIWIQMWHGTPIKKMLFDSPERFIVNKNPHHKRLKYIDSSRWDFLLSQNKFCTNALSSAFSFDKEKILNLGYPRTDALHITDREHLSLLKSSLIERYSLNDSKPILLYAPTWRDYNQHFRIKSFDYLLNIDNEKILDDYNFLVLGHPFSNDNFDTDQMVNVSGEDVQDLLLICDFLVTDYSSILFDWLLLKKPFALLWKDEQLFHYSRGVYNEILRDFSDYIFKDEKLMFNFLAAFPGIGRVRNLADYIDYNSNSSKKLLEFINQNFSK